MTRSPVHHLARRTFLTGLLAAGGLAVLEPAPAAAGAPAEARPGPTRFGNVETHVIEGSAASAALLSGPVATLLLHVARRFHYEIAALTSTDAIGLADGTELVIRPDAYPRGATGCLFPHEVAVVRDILADCGGAVRWGGDDRDTPWEGHFRIDARPGSSTLTAAAVRPPISSLRKGRSWE
ncbi:hypothetical protein ALI22I_44700 [Saccharothrix sp. ALI-22-I]|uniref:hypothetical protein n=1 Tax=Saccharothrix sp. ALI-22-I TaxID=1933778 RepID=UPI00097BE2BE|nr:hypothetical protein [Saccharothrix sp. ALI-22-I]ONI80881.1 hypothetical protein ALI22I_44700 [Saccharothrix sp. ALI-22-I]